MNQGNSSTQFRGDKPSVTNDYFKRYLVNNLNIKEGIITEVYAGGYFAQVNFGAGTGQAIWLGHLNGGLSNSHDLSIPSIGTKVVVITLHGNINVILGTIPDLGYGPGIYNSVEQSNLNTAQISQHSIINEQNTPDSATYNNGKPLDVLPGETGWLNEFGNVIALLKGLIVLKATPLAQIQLHTIDNLVRIVSNSFEHLSVPFQEMAYNDHGKCSIEKEVYSTQAESLGSNDTIIEEHDNGLPVLKEGLEVIPRIISHLGFIGDLIHLYINGPVQNQNGAEIQVDGTGFTTVRSNTGIKLIKSGTINVPIKKNEYYQREEKEYTELNKFSYSNGNKGVQEGDKESWDNEKYSKKNYHPEDYELELSTATVNTQSIIHQREDGSIILKSNSGSSIELDSNGNIILSCPKDILLKSGRDIVSLAGNSLSQRSNNHFEICSTLGSVKIKGEKNIHLYTVEEGILIESLGEEYGIKLSAENAPVYIKSGDNIDLFSDSNIVNKAELISFKCIDFELENENTVIKSLDHIYTETLTRFDITTTYNHLFTSMNMFGTYFSISASVGGKIHGGPFGTDINHIHKNGSPGHVFNFIGVLIDEIIYSNTSTPLAPIIISVQDLDTIMTPFTQTILDEIEFEFENIPGEDLFEDTWQQLASNFWDMISNDTINDTTPYPGNNFDNYKKYTPNITPQDNGGNFTPASLSNYKIS